MGRWTDIVYEEAKRSSNKWVPILGATIAVFGLWFLVGVLF